MKLCESIKIALNEGIKDFIKKKFKVEDKDFEKTHPDHCVKSIAKTAKGWVGFSHRACSEFTPEKGKKIFDPEWNDDGKLTEEEIEKMPFTKRGGKDCKTQDDCKISATNFAQYVS